MKISAGRLETGLVCLTLFCAAGLVITRLMYMLALNVPAWAVLLLCAALVLGAYMAAKKGLFDLGLILRPIIALMAVWSLSYFVPIQRSIFWLLAIIAVGGFFSYTAKLRYEPKVSRASGLLGAVFALFIFVGYQLVTYGRLELMYLQEWDMRLHGLFEYAAKLLGLFYLFRSLLYHIYLQALELQFRRQEPRLSSEGQVWAPKGTIVVFALTFAALILCWLPYLIAYWPGIYHWDSLYEIEIIEKGIWWNNHPIMHQLAIKFCLWLGRLLGDMSLGLGIFSILQLSLLAFAFAWAIALLHGFGAKRWLLVLLTAFVGLNGANGLYSVYMIKDVAFTIFAILLFSLMVRLMSLDREGKRPGALRLVTICLVAFVFSTMRNNGILAFVFALVIYLIVYKGHRKQYAIIFLGTLALLGGYKLVMSQCLEATPLRTAETLSVPLQQICRTVKLVGVEGLEPEQEEILREVYPELEQVGDLYKSYISDPVKAIGVFNSATFDKDPLRYAKVWLSLGLEHPKIYLDAFLLQCYGYFYPDLNVGGEIEYLTNQYYGIPWSPASEGVREGLYSTFGYMNSSFISAFIYCLALSIWVVFFSAGLFYIKGQKAMIGPLLLPIGYWATLLLSPVFCEFRYGYPLMCLGPIVLVTALIWPKADIK